MHTLFLPSELFAMLKEPWSFLPLCLYTCISLAWSAPIFLVNYFCLGFQVNGRLFQAFLDLPKQSEVFSLFSKNAVRISNMVCSNFVYSDFVYLFLLH